MLKNCKKSCSRLEEQKIIRSEHTDTDVRSKMRESLEIKWNHRREPWAGAEASSRVGRGEGAFSFDQTIWTTVELHSHTTNIVNCNCIIVWTQITWVPLLFTILNPPRCSTIAQCILYCLMRSKTTSIEKYQVYIHYKPFTSLRANESFKKIEYMLAQWQKYTLWSWATPVQIPSFLKALFSAHVPYYRSVCNQLAK